MNAQKKIKNKKEAVKLRSFKPATTLNENITKESTNQAFWQASIETLQGQEFANIESAVEALADAVATSSGPEIAGQRDFIKTLFMTDPSALENVKRLLRIKG